MLSTDEIQTWIKLTQLEVVVPETEGFRYQIVRQGSGYHPDPELARIQGKLSMMLEAANR